MQKVITVSLNGNAYQLDEDAYAELQGYLDHSARALATNPDRAEIIADLEQAIAEKCARYLSSHKTVVRAAELHQVLAEMGPVDDEAAAQSGPGGAPDGGSRSYGRRLYQVSEGAVLSGVCTGIAAYFAIDLTLVRAIFIALFFVTGGIALLGYLVLMFIVPYAHTSEEQAAARGLPFNARVLVEGAKQKYAQFRHGAEWQGTRAEWRAEWRRMRDRWRAHGRYDPRPRSMPPPGTVPPVTPARYMAHVITGIVIAVLSLVFALISIVWLFVLLSLLTTGAVLGVVLPFSVPLWVTVLIVFLVYQLVAWPIKSIRRAAYHAMGPYRSGWVEAWDGIFGLALAAGLLWYGYHHVPELHAWFEHFTRWWSDEISPGTWT